MIEIPESHCDLLVKPIHAVLTTMMPDGQPQSSIVWCDFDGTSIRINTTLQRQKGRNMRVNPKVSLLVIDPCDTSRYLEVRGEVEIYTEGALEHLDKLTREYTSKPHYYGGIYPEEQQEKETRIICIIRVKKITCDAIHR